MKGVLFFLLISLGSCTFFSKKVLQPNSQFNLGPWASLIKEDGSVIKEITQVRIISKSVQYQLNDWRYQGEILRGNIEMVTAISIPDKQDIRMGKVPKELREDFKRTLFAYTDKVFNEGPVELNINDFSSFKRYSVNSGLGVIATLGTIVGVTAGAVGVVAILCANCPKAYAVDEAGEKHFQGAMFTGAITKSRERIDLLPIETYVSEQDEIFIHIANEFAEVEHLNQLELLKVKRQKGYEIGFGLNQDLFEYKSLINPREAHSVDGRDFLETLSASDGKAYDFDDERRGEELNTIKLTFSKSDLKQDKAKLLVQTRQTDWMSKTVGGFFSLYGDQYDKVINRMDKVPARFFEKYNAKQGISMNAYLKTDKGWKSVGSVQNVGIFKQKLMGIDLNLAELSSDEIEIKLESAFKFWEIDQVALTEEFQGLEGYESVPLLSAINDQGENVAYALQKIDKEYAIQDGPGTYIDLIFDHTASPDEMYVLSGSGYYYEKREFTHEKQKDALKALRSKKELGADELSRVLYEEVSTLQAARP